MKKKIDLLAELPKELSSDIPLNWKALKLESSFSKDRNSRIIKLKTSNQHNTDAYLCTPFYKPIRLI